MLELIKSHPDVAQAVLVAISTMVGSVFALVIVWILKLIFAIKSDVDKLKASDLSILSDIKKLETRFEHNEGEYTRIFDSIWETAQNLKLATTAIETNWAEFRKNADGLKSEFHEMRDAFSEFTEKVNESVNAIKLEIAKKGHI